MSEPAHTLRILSSLEEIPASSWDALAPAGHPFLGHAWLSALEQSGAVGEGTGWIPRHLTIWEGDELVAAAPAYEKHHSQGEFVFDFGWADAATRSGIPYYPKLILAVPFTPVTGQRTLVARGRARPPFEAAILQGARALAEAEGYSGIHVLFPTEAEGAQLEELGFAERIGVQYHWKNAGYGSWEEFLARFTSKQRANLRRERATAGKQGIEIRTVSRDEGLDPDLLHRLYLSTVDKFVWGMRYLNRSFFERIVQTVQGIELVEARRGGQVVAGAINLASEERLYGRYWGAFEEHPFLHFNVCYYHSIDECIRRGLSVFEPGAGGEHKLSRGFEPTFTRSAHWLAHPGLDKAVREFLGREAFLLETRVASYRSSTGLRPQES